MANKKDEKQERPFEDRLIEILEKLSRHEVGTDVLIAELKADYVKPVAETTEEETA